MSEFRVIFVANDYDATVGFFTEVARAARESSEQERESSSMGLEVERSFGEIFRGTLLLAAAGRIEVLEDGAGWDTPGVAGVSVSWEITDADAEHARLVSAGTTIVRPPQLQPWGHKSFEVAGPDGLRIVLFEVVVQ